MNDDAEPFLPSGLLGIMDKLDQMMWAGYRAGRDWSDIDSALASTDLSRPTVELLGTIRCTNPLRNELREWAPLRDRIAVELAKRGLDAGRLLRGLYDPNGGAT